MILAAEVIKTKLGVIEMAHSKMWIVTIVLVLSPRLFTSSAIGQSEPTASAVEERLAVIDWERAKSDLQVAEPPSAQINQFLKGNDQALKSTRLPVLIPNQNIAELIPKLHSQGSSYLAAYELPGAQLSVMGTSVYLLSRGSLFAQSAPKKGRSFNLTEDGADLSFMKYGAAYVLRLSCSEEGDPRCGSDEFLNRVADNMLLVGGSEQ
jgi:hypothetical protein